MSRTTDIIVLYKLNNNHSHKLSLFPVESWMLVGHGVGWQADGTAPYPLEAHYQGPAYSRGKMLNCLAKNLERMQENQEVLDYKICKNWAEVERWNFLTDTM